METFIVSQDKSHLHIVEWMPVQFPRAMILLVHDWGDHILRYKNLAAYFCENQIAVIGVDLRGHGQSRKVKSCAFYGNYSNDVTALIKYAQKRYPHVPKILYGHSFGGNLAMNYVISNRTTFAGIIASSPWIRPVYAPKSFGIFNRMKMMKPMMSAKLNYANRDISHDRKVVDSYETDPFVYKNVLMSLYDEINTAGYNILKNKHKVSVPLLLMHGSGDKVTSCNASAEFARNTSSLTNFRLWHGAYHELHNELQKDEIFDYIVRWILNLPKIQR